MCTITGLPNPILLSLEKSSIETILIADDLSLNRTLVRVMLKPYGCRFEEAENGSEALEIIRRKRPDLVLMDIMMPVMDGFEAVRSIREELGEEPWLPVIAITAREGEKELDEILSAGFDGCLYKPLEEEVLLRVIREIAEGAGRVSYGR